MATVPENTKRRGLGLLHLTQLAHRVSRCLAEEREAIELLDTVPGVSQRTAAVLVADLGGPWRTLAELGTDLSRFPSVQHLAS